jgi:moxR-related protein
MLPIRNGSSFSLLQQRLRGLNVCNFATKIRFLSEKAKSFSIFLQITEVLQLEICAQKKEMKHY